MKIKYFLILILLLSPVIFSENETNYKERLYYYRAEIKEIYDGDTVTADIDLGFYTWKHDEKLRLARINAPEVRGKEKEAGKKSRDWLRELILGKTVIIQTKKAKNGNTSKGKYGRYIVEIYWQGENINDLLVTNGYAEYHDY